MFPEAVVQPMPMAGSCSVAPAGTDELDLEAAEQLIQLSGGDGVAAGDAGSESRSADSVKCGRKEKEKKEVAVESRRRRTAGRILAAAVKDGNGGSETDVKSAGIIPAAAVKDGNGGGVSDIKNAGRNPAAAVKDGNGGGESSDAKGVDSFACCSATDDGADVAEKEKEKKKEKVVVVESCRRRTAAERFSAGKDRRDGGVVHGEKRKRPRFRLLADIYRETEPRRHTAGGGEGHADRDPPPEGTTKEKKRARPTR